MLGIAPVAHASSSAAPLVDAQQAEPTTENDDCPSTAVVCAGRGALDLVKGAAGGVLGTGVDAAADGIMGAIVTWASDGAAYLIGRIAAIVDRSTQPQLTSTWFSERYVAMVQLAVALAAVFLLLAVGSAISRQELAVLLRALAALPIAFVLTFAAVTLVQIALAVTDWMTASVVQASGDDTADAFANLRYAFEASPAPNQQFVLFLVAVLVTLLAIAVWVELALREAAIYVAVAFLPLSLVAMVWRPTTVWCRRLAEGLIALILSKFVLAVAFALAAGAIGQSGSDDGGGLSAIVAGGAALMIAALSPWVLFRLVPLSQAAPDQGMNRQSVGGAARNAPGATTAMAATRMLMFTRFGAMPFSGSRAPATPMAASAGRRGHTPSDVPVAVIPQPQSRPRMRPDESR
jgi:hypothetical protein